MSTVRGSSRSTARALARVRSALARHRAPVESAAWALGDSVLRLIVGFSISIWLARYLGPEQFGLLGLASAWIALFGSLSWLGIGDGLVRDLVRQPQRHGVLLGTACLLRFGGAVLACGACVLLLVAREPAGSLLVPLAALLGAAGVVAEPSAVLYGWFQARSQLRPATLSRLIGFFGGQALRAGAILAALPLLAFGFVGVVEAVLATVALVFVFRRAELTMPRWQFSVGEAKRLLGDGLPLLLAASFAMLQLRVDQIMLGELAGVREVGVYSAAVRWSEVWWFVPTLLMRAVAPAALFAESSDHAALARVGLLSGGLFWLAVGLALSISLLVSPWVPAVLGPGFEAAGTVIAIHVWTAVPVFLDAPAYMQLVRGGQRRPLLLRAALGAGINIALNAWLIPVHGAVGASFATLVAYVACAPLAYLPFKAGRALLRAQMAGIAQIPLRGVRLMRGQH